MTLDEIDEYTMTTVICIFRFVQTVMCIFIRMMCYPHIDCEYLFTINNSLSMCNKNIYSEFSE